ncbi:unnamed protein product, partial [Allacma fusca]
ASHKRCQRVGRQLTPACAYKSNRIH